MDTNIEHLEKIVELYSKKEELNYEVFNIQHSLVKKRVKVENQLETSVRDTIDLFNTGKESLVHCVVSTSDDNIRSNIISKDISNACVYNNYGVWILDINKALLYIKQVLKNDVIENHINVCMYFKDEKIGYELSLEMNYAIDKKENSFGSINCNYIRKNKITNLIDYKTNLSDIDYNVGDETSIIKLTKDRPRIEF